MKAPLQSRQQIPRQRILERIRAATLDCAQDPAMREEAYATLPRAYTRHGQLSAEARLKLMIERLREYDAEVVETTPEALPAAIAAQLAASGKHIFVAPYGTPAAWMVMAAWQITGFEWN